MYQGRTLTLIFPAFNEEENIEQAIKEFLKVKIIDELIVVDNNSTDRTAFLAKKNKALVVKEKKQGYGYALRRGLTKATGEYIVLAEPDGTFKSNDLKRMLKLLYHCDAVLGTRTNSRYIHPDANMKFLLKWGNILLAKFTQILYQTPSLSDCGCTYRALNRTAVKKILPHLSVGSSHFLPEMVLLLKRFNFAIVEIPVHYYPRVGTSKITGSLTRAFTVGWNMFILNLEYLTKPLNTK